MASEQIVQNHMFSMRKLDFEEELVIANDCFETPREVLKGKDGNQSSCYQGSTVYTEKQREFQAVSASKFLFREDLEQDQGYNEH